MSSEGNSGGFRGFWIRLWHHLIVAAVALKWDFRETFTRHRKLDYKKLTNRSDEVAVITGGTRGIGFEVLKILLKVNMRVIMGCRKIADGKAAEVKIRKEGITSGSLTILELDLMSLDSVKVFADNVLNNTNSVNILLNNAGIMATPYKVTEDGMESQFQTNYLSHFVLTEKLYPALISGGKEGKCSRIVNVTSIAHYGGSVNFEDLQHEKLYSPFNAYMQSKLMQVISANELNARFLKNGNSVRAYSVHPGIILTGLYDHLWLMKALHFVFRPFFKTAEQGADGVAYTALSADLEGNGGVFLANSIIFTPNSKAADKVLQRQVLNTSYELAEINSASAPPPFLHKKSVTKIDIETKNQDGAVIVDM